MPVMVASWGQALAQVGSGSRVKTQWGGHDGDGARDGLGVGVRDRGGQTSPVERILRSTGPWSGHQGEQAGCQADHH